MGAPGLLFQPQMGSHGALLFPPVALALWKSTSGAFYTGLINLMWGLGWTHGYKAREKNGEQERETRSDGEHARRNFFCAEHQTIQSSATWQVL